MSFKRTQYTYRYKADLSEGLTYFQFRGGGIFHFCSNVNRSFCSTNSGDPDQMQLSWVCAVCLYRLTKRVYLGLYGINRFHYIHFYLTNLVMLQQKTLHYFLSWSVRHPK